MFSLFRLAQLAAPEIEQAGGGAILAITSMAAENKNQRMASYGSSKAATSHLVRNIAFDLGLRHIRVNAVAQVPPAPMRCNRCSPPKLKPVCSATRPSNAWASRRTWPMPPCFCVRPPPVGSVAKSSPSRAGAYKNWTKARHKKSCVSGLLFLCFILRPQGLDAPCALKTAYRLPDSAYLHIKIIAAQAVLTGVNAKMMHK